MDGSNPLSPNPSTVAMQAQDGFGRYGKLIVTGPINPKDNEASEKKAEQLALDSSSGLAHYPKMGACSYTLQSVFEPPPDSKPGPEGDPAVPIAVNTPSVEPRGTSNKSTSEPCRDARVHLSQESQASPGSRGQGSSPTRQPSTRLRTRSPGRRLCTDLSDKNYLSTLTPREQVQPLPQSGNIHRRGLTSG